MLHFDVNLGDAGVNESTRLPFFLKFVYTNLSRECVLRQLFFAMIIFCDFGNGDFPSTCVSQL